MSNIAPHLDTLNAKYRYCYGITREQSLDHHVYLKMAAENGNIYAQSHIGSIVALPHATIFESLERAWPDRERWPFEWLRLRKMAADSGSTAAMHSIGQDALAEPLFGIDRLDALGYAIAGAHLQLLAGRNSERYGEVLDELLLGLSLSEIDNAIDAANQRLQSDWCCVVVPNSIN